MTSVEFIASQADLEALYGDPPEAAMLKVATRITPMYRRWIEASPFCVLSTVGDGGTDGSPRGDDGPVVRVLDERTLAMPDWRGNNRLDTLRNIVADGRVSLMFMVPGRANVMRVNGTARLTADKELRYGFERDGHVPKSVILIRVGKVYSQCARAILRADLWGSAETSDLPSMGEILREQTDGDFDGASYDSGWPARAARTMW